MRVPRAGPRRRRTARGSLPERWRRSATRRRRLSRARAKCGTSWIRARVTPGAASAGPRPAGLGGIRTRLRRRSTAVGPTSARRSATPRPRSVTTRRDGTATTEAPARGARFTYDDNDGPSPGWNNAIGGAAVLAFIGLFAAAMRDRYSDPEGKNKPAKEGKRVDWGRVARSSRRTRIGQTQIGHGAPRVTAAAMPPGLGGCPRPGRPREGARSLIRGDEPRAAVATAARALRVPREPGGHVVEVAAVAAAGAGHVHARAPRPRTPRTRSSPRAPCRTSSRRKAGARTSRRRAASPRPRRRRRRRARAAPRRRRARPGPPPRPRSSRAACRSRRRRVHARRRDAELARRAVGRVARASAAAGRKRPRACSCSR